MNRVKTETVIKSSIQWAKGARLVYRHLVQLVQEVLRASRAIFRVR